MSRGMRGIIDGPKHMNGIIEIAPDSLVASKSAHLSPYLPKSFASNARQGFPRSRLLKYLEPAFSLRKLRCLCAVVHTQFLNGKRQVIAHRSLREAQMPGYLGNTGSGPARGQYLAFPHGQWTLPFAQGRCSQPRIDQALPGDDTPNGCGQFLYGRILEQEACHSTLHRSSQVARTPKGGEDHTGAGRECPAQGSSSVDAIHTRHLNVEEGDIWPRGEGNLDHLITAFGFRYHGHVVFQGEQRAQGTAHHCLVLC